MLSRLLYCLRLCWFWHHARSIIEKDTLAVTDEDSPTSKQMASLHTTRLGAEAPFTAGGKIIQGLRSYGMACAKAEGGRDSILWSADGRDVAVDGQWVNLAKIRTLMKDSIGNVTAQPEGLLSHAKDGAYLLAFDFEDLIDDPACGDPGMWFGRMAANKNKLNFDYAGQLLPGLVNMKKDVGSNQWEPHPDWDAVEKLWAEERVFLKSLLLAIHITSGMPNRGAELLESTWCNSGGARLRTVLAGKDGEAWFDTTYSKTDYKATRLKQNIRFLHPDIGRTLLVYLCTVRQVTDTLFQMRHGVARDYLWCDYKEDSPRGTIRWDTNVLT
ncbi:hypothetical protein A4X13_0g9499, partial [Tilletia indica]